MPPPLLLAVDGNGLLHRAHHAWADGTQTDRAGRPVWGLIGLVVAIAAAAARCEPDALVVGFDCTERSLRRERFPSYKAHRPGKPADLRAQLEDAPQLLAAAGLPVAQATGHEADDVLASAAALAHRHGWRTVLVTSDRDAFALVDGTTSVLRVIGGIDDSPMITPDELVTLYGVSPGQYRDLAVLRGDPSDNLRGAPGVGQRTAARLLTEFGSLDAVLAAVDEGRHEAVAGLAGTAAATYLAAAHGRAELERNRALMTMHDDLPLPPPQSLRLPLDPTRLRGALRERDIRLGRSLWALVGQERPPWSPQGFDKAPAALPRVQEPPWALSQWFRPDGGEPDAGEPASGEPDDDEALPEAPPVVDLRTPRPARSARRGAPVTAGQLTLF